MSALEYALASPAPAPRRRMAATVCATRSTSLHEVWTRHIVETEAPGAFLDELVDEAPRLSTPAARLAA